MTRANVDDMVLTRSEQAYLVRLLRSVPALVAELEVTVTRQDTMRRGPRVSTGRASESPLPFRLDASDRAAELRRVLASWVREVSTVRGIEGPSSDGLVALAAWLNRWVVGIALTPGGDAALPEIRSAVRSCWRIVDAPVERIPDQDAVEEKVRSAVFNARGCADAAAEYCGRYEGLTRRRVLNLRSRGHIEPVAWSGDVPLFRFGDVLDAHVRVPVRVRC